jgi:hypothetical protein
MLYPLSYEGTRAGAWDIRGDKVGDKVPVAAPRCFRRLNRRRTPFCGGRIGGEVDGSGSQTRCDVPNRDLCAV